MRHLNRIHIGIAAAVVAYLVAPLVSAGGVPGGPQISPADALQKLQVGNARYVCGKSDHPNQDAARRQEAFTGGQHPFAAVLTCSDSRVPVELIFDQGIGDVFAIRVAGNITDKHQTGSIEYAVEHLGVPLVVVMGHRACGAVAATCSKADVHGNVASIVRSIGPAVERVQKRQPDLKGDALVAEAIKENVFETIATLLSTSQPLNEMVKAGKIKVVGAVYDIEQATVSWLGVHPQESTILAAGVKSIGDHSGATDSNSGAKEQAQTGAVPGDGGAAAAGGSNPASAHGEAAKGHNQTGSESPTKVAGETATRDKKTPPPPPPSAKPKTAPQPAKPSGGHP
ncbi:MAG: carbonic anhydrase [Phycisphaerales bacterium]|nr:carbonic anhydrase [Phycisphaerales bacterium]